MFKRKCPRQQSPRGRSQEKEQRKKARSYENRGTEPRRVGAPADCLVEEAARGATADGRDAAAFLAPVGAAVQGSLGNQRARHLKISMASDAELGYLLRLPADGMAVTARRDAISFSFELCLTFSGSLNFFPSPSNQRLLLF